VINNDDDSDDGSLIGEINVTPMVDVTLVLLIIFIVTATYIIAQSIPVDLPKASTGEEVTSPIAITITKDGSIYYEGTKVSDLDELKSKVKKAKQRQMDVRAVIAADRDIKHGKFVAVVNIIREAGIARFAINIKEEDIIQ